MRICFRVWIKAQKKLKQACLQEGYGFLWLTLQSTNENIIEDYIDGLDAELKALDLGSYAVSFDKTWPLKANWKMPILPFLESYHISSLHYDTFADFLLKILCSLCVSVRIFVHLCHAAILAN